MNFIEGHVISGGEKNLFFEKIHIVENKVSFERIIISNKKISKKLQVTKNYHKKNYSYYFHFIIYLI